MGPAPAPRPREPPLAGAALAVALVPLTLMGVLLGIVSAFLVPVGARIGGGIPSLGGETGPTSPGGTSAAGRLLAAADGGAGGVPLSVGVALGALGCLGLALLARLTTGERLAGLAPVTGWLVIALLANTSVHGDLVLPAGLEPGVLFLYAGVIGGALGLLPRSLLPGRT